MDLAKDTPPGCLGPFTLSQDRPQDEPKQSKAQDEARQVQDDLRQAPHMPKREPRAAQSELKKSKIRSLHNYVYVIAAIRLSIVTISSTHSENF